jgi:hypothetical protein
MGDFPERCHFPAYFVNTVFFHLPGPQGIGWKPWFLMTERSPESTNNFSITKRFYSFEKYFLIDSQFLRNLQLRALCDGNIPLQGCDNLFFKFSQFNFYHYNISFFSHHFISFCPDTIAWYLQY